MLLNGETATLHLLEIKTFDLKYFQKKSKTFLNLWLESNCDAQEMFLL